MGGKGVEIVVVRLTLVGLVLYGFVGTEVVQVGGAVVCNLVKKEVIGGCKGK
jgi:hypothetical protein